MITKGDLVIWDPQFVDEDDEFRHGDPVGLVIVHWSRSNPPGHQADPLDRATVLWNRRGRLELGTEHQTTMYLLVVNPSE